MNVTFDEACAGFTACAEWAGQGDAGRKVVSGFHQLRTAVPSIAEPIANLMIDTYVKIVGKHGERISRDGFTLPGYTPAPVVVASPAPQVENLSDEDLLRILRPYYHEFQESAQG